MVRVLVPGVRAQEGGAAAAAGAGAGTVITAFGPQGSEALVAHTARVLPLIIRVYEKYLGCQFPCAQLHVAFLPAAAFRARDPPMLVGTNCILVRPARHVLCPPCPPHPAAVS